MRWLRMLPAANAAPLLCLRTLSLFEPVTQAPPAGTRTVRLLLLPSLLSVCETRSLPLLQALQALQV